MTNKEVAEIVQAVVDARNSGNQDALDDALICLSECDLAVFEVICTWVPSGFLKLMADNENPAWEPKK